MLKTGTAKQQFEVTKFFRRLLSKDSISTDNKFYDQVIGAGLVPKFVEFLQRDDIILQSEAGSVLINLTSGNSFHTKSVIDAGALPVLLKLLSSPSEKIQEKAACCLGNIAGDGSECKNLLIDHGILAPLLQYVLTFTF